MTTALPGQLIVFEGIDGTGKSTQISLLATYLEDKGYSVITTREPTDGSYGQKIRQLYVDRKQATREEELSLFLADRREHVEKLLLPSLNEGKIVLCDRYYLSTAAYQGANGFDPQEILRLNDFAPEPDIALLFDVSIETSLLRITKGRGEQLNAFEQAESLTKVKQIFSDLELPYIRHINAENSITDIHKDVISAIRPLLTPPLPEPLEQL